MHLRFILTAALIAVAPLAQAAPPAQPQATAEQWKAALAAREQRAKLLRDELKALDARLESRIDSIVDALTAIGDSKDSKTKVSRMKEKTIEGLKNSINYYRNKRATMLEELRRPTLRLTEEQKKRAVTVFDEHIEKRVAQILEIQKSLPTGKDYERYKVTGNDWYGPTYAVNEDYKQNKRVTNVTNTQRKEIETGLRDSIARLENQNRTLRANNGAADEIAKNDALIAERRSQLKDTLTAVAAPTREIDGKQAADLDKALQTSIADLRRDFNTLFARYNALIQELSAVNVSRDALAAAAAKK